MTSQVKNGDYDSGVTLNVISGGVCDDVRLHVTSGQGYGWWCYTECYKL